MAGRILVLDDEENYARMVHDLLRQERYLVEMATQPAEALKALREKGYDLIVSDYKMPLMDGAQFLDEARKIKPELPVIMVSGLMNTPELVKVANIGVTLVLEKPFDTEVFLEHVARFVDPLPEGTALEAEAGTETEAEGPARPAAATTVKTYPRDLAYVTDASESMQQVLQRLWDAMKAGPHLVVEAPRGSEFELLQRELSAWKGYDRRRIFTFSAIQLKSSAVQDQLAQVADDPNASKVVAITDWDDTTPDQMAYLLGFLRNVAAVAPKAKSLTFLHRVLDRHFLEHREGPEAAELKQWVTGKLVPMPPLAERRLDLAAYVTHWLPILAQMERRPEKAKLSPEAARLLLHHPWPGNFSQLIDTLRRVVQLGGDGEVGGPEMRSLLLRHSDPAAGPLPEPDLAAFLTHRQQEYLRAVSREAQQDDPLVALQATKVSADRIGDDPATAAGRLLYPELVQQV